MPHYSSDTEAELLSDEGFLVSKAKKTADVSPYRSKAWALTARTLFPQNFDVQFEAYLIEKNNGNVKEAAKFFSELFQPFIAENGLWQEIYAMTNALRMEKPDPEALFLKNVFSYIPPVIQRDILTLTAERSEDTMEHSRLMLLLFKKFPQNSSQLIIRLVDTLITAEKLGHSTSITNCFRKTLVCEVLPLLLRTPGELSSKQLYRFLHKSIEFYLARLVSKPPVNETPQEEENRIDISWESFFDLLKMFGAKLEWELSSIFMTPWNRDVAWQLVYTFNTVRLLELDPIKGVRQLIYCLTILFAYGLHQYNVTLNPHMKPAIVLIEAFVTESDYSGPLAKRLKMEGVPQDSNVPALTAGDGANDIIKHFNFAYKCWNMLNSTEVYQKEFVKLKQNIQLDSWISHFETDVALYRGNYDEFQHLIQKTENSMRCCLQKLTLNYIAKKYNTLVECSISIVKQLDSLPFLGTYCTSLYTPGTVRHLHYMPVMKIPVLQYIVKLLVITYLQVIPNFSGLDLDRIYGYLLILCQVSWPCEKHIVQDIIGKIRSQRSFTFPLFFKYITNVEILEEFMHMHAHEHDTIKLNLFSSGNIQLSGQKRMSTRGTGKEEREDFRLLMKQQVCRQDTLYTLVLQFLLEEERFLAIQ